MKQQREFPRATVTPKAERALRAGHPWVYAAEITAWDGAPDNGAAVDVVSQKGAYLGTGMFSAHSKIAVRVLGVNANEKFGAEFFARRIGYALDYRRSVMAEEELRCCRLVFGESDGLPGLTVDRFGDVLVTQVLCFGMEQRKEEIYRALLERTGACGIYERNDVALRTLEGLEEHKDWWDGAPHPSETVTEIVENGVRYTVDFENGQKTGFFLDQKYNRRRVAELAAGRRVLDCFTHTGSFALNAARGGAERVTAVDVSQLAVGQARANAALNGLEERMDFVCADVFELLPRLCEERADYDFVILDPPAFTKSRRTVRDAERGYKEINFRAMKLLPRGGLLATCSCSHFMEDARFRAMLASAAQDAGVGLKQIEARQQGPDHPILWNVPETDYLKFYLFQIV